MADDPARPSGSNSPSSEDPAPSDHQTSSDRRVPSPEAPALQEASPTEGTAPRKEEEDTSAADTRHKRLLRPLGSLYRLAQVLSSSAAQARQLVEATYRRAAGTPSEQREGRRWLLHLLVDAHRDLGEAPARERTVETSEASSEETFERSPEGSHEAASEQRPASDKEPSLRRHALRHFLRRALPAAFAVLPAQHRLLIMLCEVEQFSTLDAARISDLSEDEVRRFLENGHASLYQSLRQSATQPERQLLDQTSSENEALLKSLRQEALQEMSNTAFASVPSSLPPTASTILSRPPGRHRPRETSTASDTDSATALPSVLTGPWGSRLQRALVALLIIGVAGGAGYLASSLVRGPSIQNPVAASAQQADDVDVRFQTSSYSRAERFVREQLDRRLRVPHVQGAVLRGVGISEAAPGLQVPVFSFEDSTSGRPFTVHVYSYALLEQSDGRMELPSNLRRLLEQEKQFIHQEAEGRRALLWRRRDDIYVAITDERVGSLSQRLSP